MRRMLRAISPEKCTEPMDGITAFPYRPPSTTNHAPTSHYLSASEEDPIHFTAASKANSKYSECVCNSNRPIENPSMGTILPSKERVV